MKNSTPLLPPLAATKVLDQLRERIRYLHYSLRTEDAYVYWVRFYIRFHGRRHPKEMGGPEVEAFLSWLANERKISASTHKVALCALLFFYGKVLGVDLPWMTEVRRPRTRKRLPVVLSREEVANIFELMEGEHRLLAQLLYGTGMRISDALLLPHAKLRCCPWKGCNCRQRSLAHEVTNDLQWRPVGLGIHPN